MSTSITSADFMMSAEFRPSTPVGRRAAALGAVAALMVGAVVIPVSGTASADPAPPPSPASVAYTTPGSYATAVPDGICFATIEALGGAGGSATPSASWNGGGARVTATYPVAPTMSVSVVVGSGGEGKSSATAGSGIPGVGGTPGGARGGNSGGGANTSNHAGAGGGGYSEVGIAGTTVIVAGGGGGSSGGHATSGGRGGDAGLPTATGVAAGSNGQNGFDPAGNPAPGGGSGGTTSGPGAGGVHATTAGLNGFAGSGRTGGAGGTDPNSDTAGGGGGGWFGGGGGASTNTQGAAADPTNGPAGGGGGGGASYVAPAGYSGAAPTGVAGVVGPKLASTGIGANGSATVTWIPCAYDLGVEKSVSASRVLSGTSVTWTVAVTNTSTVPMTRGDTVTIVDSLPGGGATTISSITTSGGIPAPGLASGGVTCSAAVGAAMPASLDCSRPFAIGLATATGTRGLNAGETLTIVYTQPITGSPGDYTNTASATDRGGPSPDSDQATVTIAQPLFVNLDDRAGYPSGVPATVPVLQNDFGNPLPSSVRILDGSTPVSTLTVPGQGTWTVDPATGSITFTPEAGYTGDPTPIRYTAQNEFGESGIAGVTIQFLPDAVDDVSLGNPQGSTVVVRTVANDSDNVFPETVDIVDVNGAFVGKRLEVPGQGVWSVDPVSGDITFTPEPGFTGNPTPIRYRVVHLTDDGSIDIAKVTVTYQPAAANDVSNGNTLGSPAIVDVLANDSDNIVPGSVRILDGATPVTSLVVPGQGTWSVDTGTGAITFTPQPGYTGNPDQIDYRADDGAGNAVTATVEVRYTPVAEPDSSLGNPIGDPVTIDVLANDSDNLDPTTVRILDGTTPVTTLVIPGEGAWSVDPVTGVITFTPDSGFQGSPDPIRYEVRGAEDTPATATVTVTYAPDVVEDADLDNPVGSTVTVDVLANDRGDFDPSTVALVDGRDLVTTLVVPGEGTWTVDTTDGSITFAPEAGFVGDPTPVAYQVTDSLGIVDSATVTVTYVPDAVDDLSLDNPVGVPVAVEVLANDTGDFDLSTLVFTEGGGTTLVVPGQGRWTIDPSTGTVTFTPLPGFRGNPDPVAYSVTDTTGDTVTADVTVNYVPVAEDDRSAGNTPGTSVTVDVIENDLGDLDPASVRIVDPVTGLGVLTLVVAGEGTWRVNADGTITFTPQAGFTGDPTPIRYQVANSRGVLTSAVLAIDYLAAPAAPPVTGPAGLPMTGAEATSALAVGAALIIGGLGILLLRRLRRHWQS